MSKNSLYFVQTLLFLFRSAEYTGHTFVVKNDGILYKYHCFLLDLLSIPPGFTNGMEFEHKVLGSLLKRPKEAGGVIDLREIMAQEQDIMFEQEDTQTETESVQQQDNKQV